MIKKGGRSLKRNGEHMYEDKDISTIKRGYLKEDFRFFHLKDKKHDQFEFHYHDFNKIIIFISGKVTYLIEGKAYKLKPWDILLVNSNEVHKPLIDTEEAYERIVIWVNSSFLIEHNSMDCNLLSCFEEAFKEKLNMIRLKAEYLSDIKYILSQLESACKSSEFGSDILKNSLFLQLIVYINRLFLGTEDQKEIGDIEYDKNIAVILKYINDNLKEDLSIENLAVEFYMSKYYLMHRFKAQTGYTVHSYILQKRLILAKELIKKGRPVTEVYLDCGFSDYSNFIRAFKNSCGLSPKKYYKAVREPVKK